MPINTNYSGIINIDKPPGLTSHDVIDKIRRVARMKKVGHAGTLDPMATGVLLVMLGAATRLMEYAHDLPKTYRAEITLGGKSDTDDALGEITASLDPLPPSLKEVIEVLRKFTGNIEQIPPAYAAIKVKGKKLYEYARKNQTVERKPRPAIIHRIEILKYRYPIVDVRITCGSGTYIRSIARDAGDALRTGGYLSALRRESIGEFTVDNAVSLDKLTENNIDAYLIPPQQLITHLPAVTVTPEEEIKLKQGRPIPSSLKNTSHNQAISLFSSKGDLIGVGYRHLTQSLLYPKKIL